MTLAGLEILYRGPLLSCNYDCGYCPFAKTRHDSAMLAADEAALERFVAWVCGEAQATVKERSLRLLFTPWGEAMYHPYYQDALAQLSRAPVVENVAIQTNGSGALEWLAAADLTRLSLWVSYHPGEVTRARFLERCEALASFGVQFSVGVVGKREHFAEIEALRSGLPAQTYLWVNAFKSGGVADYTASERAWLQEVDPFFSYNVDRHPSAGRDCAAGRRSFTVDGVGDVRRCHFVGDKIGNLFEDGELSFLRPRACPNATCGCYIGYTQLPAVAADLVPTFGAGLLARNPQLAATPTS